MDMNTQKTESQGGSSVKLAPQPSYQSLNLSPTANQLSGLGYVYFFKKKKEKVSLNLSVLLFQMVVMEPSSQGSSEDYMREGP